MSNIVRMRAARSGWFALTNVAGATPELLIYDEIGLYGITAQDLVDQLSRVVADDLTVRINTPGGDVFQAMAIHNALVEHPARVTTVVDGLAASAGSFILQAGEHRLAHRNSQIMIHEANSYQQGDARELAKTAELLERMSAQISDIYARRTGAPAKTWRDAMLAETWYSGEEAVSAGLVDALVGGEDGMTNTLSAVVTASAAHTFTPAAVPRPAASNPTIDTAALAAALRSIA